MIALYARQHSRKSNVQTGAAYAVVGALGLFYFDALNYVVGHHVFVFILVIGAWHWRKDMMPWQTMFAHSGFAVGLSGVALTAFTGNFLFGSAIGVGECMILFTWASMIFNP
jgi:hypothetical protein